MKEIEKELLRLSQENKSCIILLSGGIDSSILLFMLTNLGFSVNALTINYDGRNPREIRACEEIAEMAAVNKLIKVDLSFLKEIVVLANDNELTREISSKLPSYYIPARNMIFISIAAYFAECLNSNLIFTGHIKSDSSSLPDVGYDFMNALNKVIELGTYLGRKGRLKVVMPFLELNKDDLVELAVKYKLPLDKTWSCHDAGNEPCNKCKGCVDRKAFMEKYIEAKQINRRSYALTL